MGYPTWIYHDTFPAKVVDSDECKDLLADGWRDHPKRENQPEDIEQSETELEALKIEADLLGIRVTGHATVSSLRKKIDEANGS